MVSGSACMVSGGRALSIVVVALGRHQPLDDRVEVLLRRGVVGDDDLVGHAEQAEQDGRHHAGAVLAGRAVVDGRRVGRRRAPTTTFAIGRLANSASRK